MRNAFKGGKTHPQTVSLIIVYTLAKALAISPLEIYKMPTSLVLDLIRIHFVAEELKAEELDRHMKSVK